MLPFAKQFEVFVWEGSKVHSVRGFRKGWPPEFQPKPEELANCYGDSRTKNMHLLGRFPFKPCDYIEIWPSGADFLCIAINQSQLGLDEAMDFAWRDGFRPQSRLDQPLTMMRRFWDARHKVSDKRFSGVLLHWDYRPNTSAWRPVG